MSLIRTASLFIVLLAFHCGEASALATGRSNAATVLLPSGDLMVIGGCIAPAANTKDNTTEIFFTSASAWGAGLPMTVPRSSHTATVLSDGRVLVAGGFNSGGVPLQSAEIYNPATRVWATMNGVAACTAKMCFARGGHTATLINRGTNKGKVLLCGGQTAASGVSISGTCETFDPFATYPGVFAQAASMNSQRIGHTASATNKGTVFVSGGRTWDVANATWTYLPTNELYDGSLTWTPVTSLNQGRAFHVATALNTGNIMIAGGYAGSASSATIYDSPEESWHSTDEGLPQRAGSRGYLGTAEIFDPNGGRVQIAGKDFITMPYRAANQAALLMPDGSNHIHGGYGNIVPKLFNGAPIFEAEEGENVRLYIARTSVNTATVDPTSELKFKLTAQLARTVDGRIVDGDFFISQPMKGGDPFSANEQQRGDPAISAENMKVWLVRSTAPLDGSPVGSMIDGGRPGEFKDRIWPRYFGSIPGTVKFANQTVTSKNATISHSYLAWTNNVGAVNPTSTMASPPWTSVALAPTLSSITANVSFTIPAMYVGGTIVGSATIKSEQPAVITPSAATWTASITGATGDINTVVAEDADTKMGLVSIPVYFHDVEGTVTNLTAYTTYYSGANAAGEYMSNLALYISYTVNGVKLDRLTYTFSVSTIVIRGMMFSDYLVYTPKDSNWSFGSPLNVPLIGHSAIVTPGADSYLVGGEHCEDLEDDGSPDPYVDCTRASVANIGNVVNPYDIYDTKVDWVSAVKLTSKRAFHTSTMLPDGYILTCGGSDGSATLSTCEQVNTSQTAPPGQKFWVFASSMTYARSRHTATLLPNGYVLAAGGTTGASSAAVNTSEIYYPATKRWVQTTLPMNTARQNHTATLLPDGSVLAAGGSSTGTYANTSEIFLTTAAIWNSAGNMLAGRTQHTATLLKNGRVLVAGGVNGAGPMKTSEIYNPVTQTWGAGPALNTARYSHTASLLKDGRVMITGGSDNFQSQKTAEVYDGVSWKYVQIQGAGGMEEAAMNLARANHRTVLLPNGKLMITGGEAAGVSQIKAEGFDVDMSSFQYQGRMEPRANHTTVLTPDNRLMNIGGWDGTKCLDTTETLYFSFAPDSAGVDPKTRNPVISTGTMYFDRGQQLTLLSATTNFHGMTEASGGGAGPMNASYSNPRIYLQAIDSPSGFLTDLTTRLYTIYGSSNTDWETTLSSITVAMSTIPAEVPYGWYHVRVAANGMFSSALTVQATIPRPAGHIIDLAGQVTGATSVYWTWNADTEMNANVPLPDGYGIFSSSDSVFLTTVAFNNPAFTHTNLVPNTRISVKIGAYNTGGYGELIESPTYYTWAVTPQSLTVQRASFESVALSWDPAGNSSDTPYEITMVDQDNPGTTLTPVPFNNNFTSTFTTISMLVPNKYYDFRVQAKNGAGILTGYSLPVTTITVANIANLKGTALTVSQINWAWDPSVGSPGYEVYGVIGLKVTDVAFLSSTTVPSYTQSDVVGTALSTNTAYQVRVNAFKTYYGPVRGPAEKSRRVYTLAAQPLPGVPSVFTSLSTGSLVLNWIANGNPSSTSYIVNGAKEATPQDKVSTFTATIMDTRLNLNKLLPNTSYSFQVSAVNGDNIATDPVNLGSVYTLAQSPARVRPTAITMSGVTLNWDPGENPITTIYEVRGSTASLITGPFMSPTPQPFSEYRTATSFSMNGLLTSTTYYFDVAARNRAATPVVTGRTQAVPAAFTLPGPNGAPSGSVGGTSNPAQDVTIEGTLPNNRFVSLYVPSGAFASQTSIAISSWSPGPPITTNPCGYQIGAPVHPLEVAIYSDGGSQPQVPVTITLKYDGESPGETHESTRIGLDIAKLVLARYNPVTGSCLPLETMINTGLRTITATLDHFSVFQLMLKTAASNLSAVRVFPNPLYINRGPNLLTIDNMPASAKVRIYTLSGDKVWEGTASSTGDIHWRGVNSAGVTVGSGIYLAVIDSSAGKKVVKIAVER